MFHGPFQPISLSGLFAAVALSLFCHNTGLAGISGPPGSYVVSVGNDDKLLVMLSPVPLAKDKGDLCKLPTGELVSLRETFPSSGLYESRSNTPIWSVSWFAREYEIKLSNDCRYLVRVNEFGDGGFGGRGGKKRSWGLKFYDAGTEIKSHDVEDMVDYPLLMPLTSSNWHLMWYAGVELVESKNGELFVDVRTSTRDRFRFDAQTGALLEERRFWRNVARGAIIAAVLVGLGAVFLLIRRLVSPRRVVDLGPFIPDTNVTFSLRSLLVAVTIAGISLGISRFAPRTVILLSGLGLCGFLSVRLYRARRRTPWPRISQRAKRRRIGLWLATSCSWLWCYLICFPAIRAMPMPVPWDVRVVLLYVVYGPVLWLYQNTRVMFWYPIDWYTNGW